MDKEVVKNKIQHTRNKSKLLRKKILLQLV